MIIAFVLGLFVGGISGVLLFACCAMSGLQDDMQERFK